MGESTETIASTLSDLLTGHKERRGVGDAKIASLASDRVGIPGYVTRSTVRNWATGSSASVNNWRQLALIASTLQLPLDEADELMAAGGCDKVSALLRFARDDDALYLAYWAEDRVASEPDTERPPLHLSVTVDHDSPEVDHKSAELAEISFPPPTAIGSPSPPIGQGQHRSSPGSLLPWAAAVFLLFGVLIALVIWFMATQRASVVQVSSGDRILAEIPAATSVDLPVAGSTIRPGFIVAGTAEHPSGIEHVELILKNLDDTTYWNPITGRWQTEFVRFIVPVEADSAVVAWEYRLPVPVPSGEYRARAWALSADGDDDPIGPMSNFTVETDVVIDLIEGASADPDGPNQLVAPPPDDGFPQSTLDSPAPAEVVGRSVVVHGTASDPEGIAYVELIFRNLDDDLYWNPELGAWQEEFIRFAITVDPPGGTDVSWSFQHPEQLDPGAYRARVWATSSSGGSDEERTLSDFVVE